MLELELTPTACADPIEVPPVCGYVQLERIVTRVAHEVEGSFIFGDVCRCRDDVVRRTDVVFWTDMCEPKRNRW